MKILRRWTLQGKKAGFEKASTLAEQAIDILDKYVPEKKSMFASLEGKALIEREEEERIRNERRDLLKNGKTDRKAG